MPGLALIAALLLVAEGPGKAADPGEGARPPGPRDTVVSVRDDLLGAVSACRFALATDPAALRTLADRVLRPALDVLFAGQVILGKWWGEATPDQRRRFSQALYGSLANRYAPSLLLLTGQTVSFGEADGPDRAAGEAVVPVVIRAPGYPPMPVELVMRRTNARWKLFDARFEDLSPVLQLREQFSARIRRDGLEPVIRQLEAEAAAGLPGPLAGRCLEGRGAS